LITTEFFDMFNRDKYRQITDKYNHRQSSLLTVLLFSVLSIRGPENRENCK
jgi:hypothetical protein